MEPREIERALRIWKFQPNNHRPITVKCSFFKTKDAVLSKGFKFKGASFRVAEDFSAASGSTRKKMSRFAREKNNAFKLRYKN